MAKVKTTFKVCFLCMERYAGKAFEQHFVDANGQRQCAGSTQRKMMFSRRDGAWYEKS